MLHATGLVLHFTRCNAPARSDEWAAWLREEHVKELAELDCVRASTHSALLRKAIAAGQERRPLPGLRVRALRRVQADRQQMMAS